MKTPRPRVEITTDDFEYFVGRAVRGMAVIVAEMGADAHRRPPIPDANSAYALLNHCLGVIDYWAGGLIAGRAVDRDRAAEFDAVGPVDALLARVEPTLAQFRIDIADMQSERPLRIEPDAWSLGPDRPLDQGAALLHLYEEMAQHHGQMQILRDALIALEPSTATATGSSFAPSMGWLRSKQGVKWRRPGPDLIPAWVADMDFPVPPVVREAITATVDRGDLGYPDWPQHPLEAPFEERMRTRFGWSPIRNAIRGVTDLIQAVQLIVRITTDPGDAVVAQTPNYPPFIASIENMDRRLVALRAIEGHTGWEWDLDRLERDLVTSGARVMLLVNPHNPTGRVASRVELERLGELVLRHDMTVISDEIHADLVDPSRTHVPIASLSDEIAERTVTVYSATKAFNIAGLRTALAHVGPERIRRSWDAFPPDLFGATNVLGVEATLAAWEHGDPWLAQLLSHLAGQRTLIDERLRPARRPGWWPPEASYLAWLDFRRLGLTDEPARLLHARAHLELSPGLDFGPHATGFARLNFATSTEILEEILRRMAAALDT